MAGEYIADYTTRQWLSLVFDKASLKLNAERVLIADDFALEKYLVIARIIADLDEDIKALMDFANLL